MYSVLSDGVGVYERDSVYGIETTVFINESFTNVILYMNIRQLFLSWGVLL